MEPKTVVRKEVKRYTFKLHTLLNNQQKVAIPDLLYLPFILDKDSLR